jgi:VWFA-related protein
VQAFRTIAGAEQLQEEREGVKNAPSTAGPNATAAPDVTSLRQSNFVAVVFGDIAPLNLEFAREAVQEFLKSDTLPNTYVSIYRAGRTLTVARFYTDDKDLLAKSADAIAKGLHTEDGLNTQAAVVGSAYSNLQAVANNVLASPTADRATQDAVRNAILNPLPIIARDPLFARDASSQDASFVLGNAILAQARIENGIRFATSLAEGMNTIDSLREIVRGQETLPGRKLVLYLADGLNLPVNRRDAFDNLVSYANRAGVAFYAVDTGGNNVYDPMVRSLAEQ